MNNTMRELDAEEILAVGGGWDGDYCGTIPRRWPFPRSIWILEPEPLPWLPPVGP